MCTRNNVSPSTLLCDPKVPQKHRIAKFNIRNDLTTITANGKKKTKKITDLWHKYELTSRFTFVDQQNTGVPEGLTDAEWHDWMVINKPLEYVIYNAVDLFLQRVIEDKTKDLSVKILNMLEFSSINKFTSGPNKIVDDIYHYALTTKVNNEYHVLGVRDPYKKPEELLGRDDWIVTLDGFRMKDNGLKIIKGIPELITRIRAHVYDSDAVSSYPSNTMALGLSSLTTLREIINVKNIPIGELKRSFINLIMGPVKVEEKITLITLQSLSVTM